MAVTAEDAIWNAEGAQKRASVQAMFGDIAPTYDRLNGILSLSLHHRWRAAAVRQLNLKPGDSALDLCSGTGDFIAPLRRSVGAGRVVAVDFALPMLEVAREKMRRAKLGASSEADLSLGDACRLPLQSESFEGVTVGWGIRNVPDIDGAHREIARVLKPGGRFVSLDMAQPRNPIIGTVSSLFCGTIIPAIGSLFGKSNAYTYLPKSTERFWSREQLADSMERAGFTDVGCRDFMLGNICMHWGTKA